jgi:hypothetical protein
MSYKTLLRSFALCFFATLASHAQVVSVYVVSANNYFSTVPTGTIQTLTTQQEQYTSFWSSGVGGGVTLNFLRLPLISLGLDVRGSTRPGAPGSDTGMVGIRLQVKPPVLRIKPYIEAAGGYLATRTADVGTTTNASGATVAFGGTFTGEYGAYEILGGIDYPLTHFLDFRVIEVGGGKAYQASTNVLNSSHPSLFNIDTGLVLHF